MKNIYWLVSYPKSGNTWFRMFLANYLANASKPLSLNEIQESSISSSATDFEDLIGLDPFELYPEETDLYRPDLYRIQSEIEPGRIDYKKTHDAYTLNQNNEPLFPEDVSLGAIYFVRNPMDVCVSYANHSSSKIEKTVRLIQNKQSKVAGHKSGQLRQILLSWQDHYFSWCKQSQIPVLLIRYEDMKRTPMEAFGKMIRFLNLEYDEERLSRSIINSDFKLLQQMEKEKGFKERIQQCKSFFWKGAIGNYQDHLSEKQVEEIIQSNFEGMYQLGYIDNNGKITI